MSDLTGKVIPIAIEDEIKESYLNYAMSVIVSRALPDVRDGLKPVHRRILYGMSELGLRPEKPFRKCGLIVGDVLGKYHPHGDQSIYDALVRLAQDFSMRYPVVWGQGNFGSVDGDPPAAYRYTEAKMQKIAEEILRDINKDTVDFGPNYDDSREEPTVLPTRIPYLLVNGTSGIAVGMATNMAPHNLTEVNNALIALIDNPDITIDDLCNIVEAPDFPTGGIIYGRSGIKKAYKTGKGKVVVRAKCSLETTKTGKDVIIVTELPYLVNKANLLIKIAEMVRDKKIDGISDLRDESDRNGMRMFIELKKGAMPKVVLNQLFAHTALQQNFNINNLALVDGRPQLLNIKQMLHHFIEHRKVVIIRRTKYDLAKAEEKAHILEGLKIALDNIDEVIRIIKSSKTVDVARMELMKAFNLSERQSQAILDMRLQRLTSLETQKIEDELNATLKLIAHYKELLANEHLIMNLIKEETNEMTETYGDDRRTEIVPDEIESLNIEDLIKKEDMVVVISNKGFIKRMPVSAYKSQGRGGKGSSTAKLKNEDFLENLFIASTHDYIMFISSAGKAYWIKVHEIPEGSKAARGTQIRALLAITADEDISAVVSINEFVEDQYILMATRRGVVKKVPVKDFSNARTKGIRAINLDNNDSLVHALKTTGDNEVVLVSRRGLCLRFHEEKIRSMGRASRGVCGIKLHGDDELTGVVKVNDEEKMFIISEFGYGKRTEYNNFTPHGRGTKGQIGYKTNEKTGEIVGVKSIHEDDHVICITSQGNTVKIQANTISIQGKAATGVCVVNIDKPDFLIGAARVVQEEETENIIED